MKQHNRLTIFILLFLCVPGLLKVWPSVDQVYANRQINPASQANGTNPNSIKTERIVIQPQEAAGFMDGFWQEKLQPLQIPGAVFVLVQDGQIVFSKGYGLADLAENKPVDPASTLFAVGSVSKAVTAGAVLQLVQAGRLDLNQPVNKYLHTFQITKECGSPIHTTHLLTHTAGFDERAIGAFVLSPDDLVPLAAYEADQLPPCIRPPGQEMSYCNHCFGLAGLLVEEISGQPFSSYIEEHLFEPLEMRHSSFRQPLPVNLEGLRAVGYIFSPRLQPAPLVYANFFPSGGLWATGVDMGRLMIGYLQGGLPGKTQVFEQTTLEMLHQRQFSQSPQLEGWTYGFFETIEDGQRLIGKEGDNPGFSSALFLMPDQDLGFFVSYNATVPAQAGVVDPRLILPGLFLEHFFPGAEGPLFSSSLEGKVIVSGIAPRVEGLYRWSRFSHTSVDKIISPMSILQWHVTALPDGSLRLSYPALIGGQTSIWLEVEPGLFQNPQVGNYLAVEQDPRGRVSHIYTKITEEGVLERVAWYETLGFMGSILVFMVGVFLVDLVVLGVTAVKNFFSQRRNSKDPGHPKKPRITGLTCWISGSLAGLNLIFLVTLALTVMQSLMVRAPQIPAYLPGLLVIPLITSLLALLMVGLMIHSWFHSQGTLWNRILNTLVSLAGLMFVWFSWYWNLLGYKL